MKQATLQLHNDSYPNTMLAIGKLMVRPRLREVFRQNPCEALILAGVEPKNVDLTAVTAFLNRLSEGAKLKGDVEIPLSHLGRGFDGIIR